MRLGSNQSFVNLSITTIACILLTGINLPNIGSPVMVNVFYAFTHASNTQLLLDQMILFGHAFILCFFCCKEP